MKRLLARLAVSWRIFAAVPAGALLLVPTAWSVFDKRDLAGAPSDQVIVLSPEELAALQCPTWAQLRDRYQLPDRVIRLSIQATRSRLDSINVPLEPQELNGLLNSRVGGKCDSGSEPASAVLVLWASEDT